MGIEKSSLGGKEVVPISLNPYTIIIDENQERVEWGREEKGGGLLLPIHTPWKRRGNERSNT